jgi:hypothetical protein
LIAGPTSQNLRGRHPRRALGDDEAANLRWLLISELHKARGVKLSGHCECPTVYERRRPNAVSRWLAARHAAKTSPSGPTSCWRCTKCRCGYYLSAMAIFCHPGNLGQNVTLVCSPIDSALRVRDVPPGLMMYWMSGMRATPR